VFAELLDALPGEIDRFHPAPSAHDRAAWEAVPEFLRAEIVARAESLGDFVYPPLSATRFMDFKRSGDRAGFELPYMTRRRALNAAAMAECVEHRGRFLDLVIDGIFALCEESGWQLPAHNTLIRDTPTTVLPDADTPVLDLFACETGAQLAMIERLLGAELDAVSPLIRARIHREIRARIVAPYLSRHFWWMGNGDEPMCNWTAWCTQNVLLTVMSGAHSAELRRRVVVKAAGSLDAFLKDYAEDGCCEEGAQYYRHAGLCLFSAATILDAVSRGAFAPAFRTSKMRNIAEYILNINIRGETYFNFADCSPLAGRAGVREYLFARAVGSEDLADFAAADWATSCDRDLPDEINLFHRVTAAMTAREVGAHRPRRPRVRADAFYPSVGLFILRDPVFDLAVKAGDNGDSHGHADSGSLILYANGRPALIDVGVESYTAKTFCPSRNEIWTIRSGFHNLPVFDGVEQGYGAGFGSRDATFEADAAEARVSMELAGAYPGATLVSARRYVRLIRGRRVEIEDVRIPAGPSVLHLMVAVEPAIEENVIHLPGIASIAVECGEHPSASAIPVSDPRLRAAWPDRLFRIAIPFADRVRVTIVQDLAGGGATEARSIN